MGAQSSSSRAGLLSRQSTCETSQLVGLSNTKQETQSILQPHPPTKTTLAKAQARRILQDTLVCIDPNILNVPEWANDLHLYLDISNLYSSQKLSTMSFTREIVPSGWYAFGTIRHKNDSKRSNYSYFSEKWPNMTRVFKQDLVSISLQELWTRDETETIPSPVMCFDPLIDSRRIVAWSTCFPNNLKRTIRNDLTAHMKYMELTPLSLTTWMNENVYDPKPRFYFFEVSHMSAKIIPNDLITMSMTRDERYQCINIDKKFPVASSWTGFELMTAQDFRYPEWLKQLMIVYDPTTFWNGNSTSHVCILHGCIVAINHPDPNPRKAIKYRTITLEKFFQQHSVLELTSINCHRGDHEYNTLIEMMRQCELPEITMPKSYVRYSFLFNAKQFLTDDEWKTHAQPKIDLAYRYRKI